jgi:dihydroxy-acid dehydratase
MHALGFRRQDLDKPQIVIVNSWTDANPGHKPLRGLSETVREGIWSAGDCPTEFNLPAPCDGVAQGPEQHYVLPQRDLISASIEAMVQTHGFEGMVMLAYVRDGDPKLCSMGNCGEELPPSSLA